LEDAWCKTFPPTICGAGDRPFIFQKGGAARELSASVQTLQDQHGKGLVEVMKEEQ
jgi:hypothetical protein